MIGDREKAAAYIREISPGHDFTSKDLGTFIGRKKSETLRVIQYLLDQKMIEKVASGPATCYRVTTSFYETFHPDYLQGPVDSMGEPQGKDWVPLVDNVKTEFDAKKYLKSDSEDIRIRLEKNQANHAHKYFLIYTIIQDEHDAIKDRLEWLSKTYEREPMFRNDYLLQFLYGQLELLEKLREET